MTRRLRALACACSPLATADSGAAGIWTEMPRGTTNTITATEYQSPTRFCLTTSAGAILTRRPDGSFAATRAPDGVPLNDIEFQTDGPIGLAVGNGGRVLRSTDSGQTWSAITDIPVSGYSGLTSSSNRDDQGPFELASTGHCALTGYGRGDATGRYAFQRQNAEPDSGMS